MKLFVFSTGGFDVPKFTVEEFLVEEKARTFVCKGRRFNKEDVGKVTGYKNNEVILLSNNPSKAASILIPAKERELEELRKQMQRKEDEIANLKLFASN